MKKGEEVPQSSSFPVEKRFSEESDGFGEKSELLGEKHRRQGKIKVNWFIALSVGAVCQFLCVSCLLFLIFFLFPFPGLHCNMPPRIRYRRNGRGHSLH